MTIDTKDGTIVFNNPIALDDFGEALDLFDRLIKLVSGDDNRTVTFKEFTDWLATTEFVKLEAKK
jgi:hypothetical protein